MATLQVRNIIDEKVPVYQDEVGVYWRKGDKTW
jgi:hypothetical protein